MREHTPVLLHEAIGFLEPKPGRKFIDATIGRGGHTAALLKSGAKVLGIDADATVVANVKAQMSNVKVVQGNFGEIEKIAEENGFTDVDGILMDLGLGSHQLDDAERGFSFQKDGPLDMRFNPSGKIQVSKSKFQTAGDMVNHYSDKDLLRIFYKYGEEKRFGRRVVRAILDKRKLGSIGTTAELFEIIKQALPGQFRFKAGDTARKIFQALRIEVNDELANLERGLPQAVSLLKNKGRLVVISFHSLEDRIVKSFFVKEAKDCVCPPSFPVCTCASRAHLRILTKKPITASEEEVKNNSRARSAKLRAAEKI